MEASALGQRGINHSQKHAAGCLYSMMFYFVISRINLTLVYAMPEFLVATCYEQVNIMIMLLTIMLLKTSSETYYYNTK
jgi:hypothetical protein